MSIKRKKTKSVKIGNVKIGDFAPISVQSMTNTQTEDIKSTVLQIKELEKAGCEIIRLAIPNKEAAKSIKEIKKQISIPIIADIHFDWQLAIVSAKNGANALRINPGNIGGRNKLKSIINCAKDYGLSIRIGVNAGSLEKNIEKKTLAEKMLESSKRNIEIFNALDFDNIKISLKASDTLTTIKTYRLFAKYLDYPLHIGITESGSLCSGLVKSSIGIGSLLLDGIGDTIRVSLSANPIYEVRAAYDILRTLKIRNRGPEIIACPTCGRCKIDLFSLLAKIEKKIIDLPINIKIAVMGCVVNGPGEAKDADIGMAGADGKGIIFKKGKIIKKISYENLYEEMLKEINKLVVLKKNEKKK